MSPVRFELVAFVVMAVVLFGARHGRRTAILGSSERFLNGHFAPVAAGGLSLIAVWWVWGSLAPPPLISDELSYLLQARLFAAGQWSAASPPLPQFFEQEHVLLVPRLASKYPPGHALVLSPGVFAGMPALMPLLFTAVTGALVFLLARQLSNGWVAAMAWLLWISASGNLIYRASYFSEVTTGALWVGGWWATLQWFKSQRSWLLIVLAAMVGWGAITRPLTMLAFAVPVATAIVWKIWQARRWSEVIAPLAMLLAVCSIIPIWSSKVTGDWRRTPLELYTESYMPWDVPGFGLVETAATREGPPDARDKWAGFMDRHRNHRVESLPRIAGERLLALNTELLGGWRQWLLPAALVGFVALNGAGWIGVACGVSLFLAYLLYAHPPSWVVYYMELFPLVGFLIALGIWRIAILAAARIRAHRDAAPEPSFRADFAIFLLLPLFGALTAIDIVVARQWWERRAAHRVEFESLIAGVRDSNAVVFVRHAPDHAFFTGHVENDVDRSGARIWRVHDLGHANAALRAIVPQRSFYLLNEPDKSIEPLR